MRAQYTWALLLLAAATNLAAQEPVELRVDGNIQRDDIIVISSTGPGRWKILGPGVLQITHLAPGIGQPTLNEKRTWVSEDKMTCIFAGGPGSYSVLFAPDDPEQNFKHLPIFIGGTPDPDNPDPTPPEPIGCAAVPEDRFDDIGRRACAWAPTGQQANAARLSAIYRTAATDLAEGGLLDIDDATAQIQASQATLDLAAWEQWSEQVSADLAERELDRQDTIDYLNALANGLAGGSE